jgi:hypothetical protein
MFSSKFLSVAGGAVSFRTLCSAERLNAMGAAVWQEVQNVPRSRADFGQVIHHAVRPSMYAAALAGLQPDAAVWAKAEPPASIKQTNALLIETSQPYRAVTYTFRIRSFGFVGTVPEV